MSIAGRLLVIVFVLFSICSVAQTGTDSRQPRILILLDGSSSMGYEWQSGEKRFDAASRIIISLIDSVYKVNKNVEFALRVYGHQYPSQLNNCYDTKLEVMFSKDNIEQMRLRLANLNAIGVSPIAFSIKEAAENDMPDQLRNVYSMVLITDGAESCGGDICAVAKELLARRIDFKPYILSLVDNGSLKSGYECLGNYLPVVKEADMKTVVGKIVDNYKQMFTLPVLPKKEINTAVVSTPSVQQIAVPKVEVKKEPEIKQEIPVAPPVPKPLPKETLTGVGFASSGRSFPIYYGTPVPPVVKVPAYIRPNIQDEPVPKPIPPPVQPKPQPPVVTKPPVKKEEPVQIIKAQEIKPTNDTVKPTGDATFQVYITDGEKFYETAPTMALLDKQTRKEVFRFSRTVNIGGVPHRQKYLPGDYYLTIVGKENKYLYDVTIEAGKNKSFAIAVQNGSIVFSYKDNPKRQISGYMALVFRRFESQPSVEQRVEQELHYEPGTYNVRINTLPPWNKSFDLDIGTIYGVEIPEEGDLVIANDKPIGKINLYYPIGDRFRPFYNAVLNGNGTPIRLKVLPGTYKLGYKKNPQIPLEEETMQVFTVTSNNVTNLEIIK